MANVNPNQYPYPYGYQNNHCCDHNDHDRSDILNAINENAGNNRLMDSNNLINKNIYDSSIQTQLQVARTDADVQKGFAEVRSSNLVDGGFTRAEQADQSRDIVKSIERNGGDTRTSVVQQGSDVKTTVVDSRGVVTDAVNRSCNQILDVINTGNADLKYNSLINSVDIKNVVSAGFSNVEKSLCENKYESLKQSYELSKQMKDGFCENKYEALKNAMQASKELAECCCELKNKIEHTAKETQDTVKEIENNRLRDMLANTRDELNLFKFHDRFDKHRCHGNNGNGNGNGNGNN